MFVRFGIFCLAAASVLCCAAFAQGSDADADKDAAPKAHEFKGGASRDEAPAATEDQGEARDGEKTEGQGEKTPVRESLSTFKIEGDTVVLKSGRKLRGAKVLRVSPSVVELEYAPGQPPMKIPRRLVASIESANPANAVEGAAGAEKTGSDVMVAEEISAEFNKKLTAPVPGAPLEFKDQDALTVLKDLADRAQVALTVDPEAQQVPEADRKMTLSVPATATLSALLREEFKKAVPALKFSLQFDKILVTSTAAESKKAAGTLPPALAPKASE